LKFSAAGKFSIFLLVLLGFWCADQARAQDLAAPPPSTPAQKPETPKPPPPPSDTAPAPSPSMPDANTAPAPAAPAALPQPASFDISGTVRAGKTPLPGVTVTAANTLTGKKFSVATASNGTYTFTGLPRGRYVVRVEFMGFATQTQEMTLKPETPWENSMPK
jgi:hypothetical protein